MNIFSSFYFHVVKYDMMYIEHSIYILSFYINQNKRMYVLMSLTNFSRLNIIKLI